MNAMHKLHTIYDIYWLVQMSFRFDRHRRCVRVSCDLTGWLSLLQHSRNWHCRSLDSNLLLYYVLVQCAYIDRLDSNVWISESVMDAWSIIHPTKSRWRLGCVEYMAVCSMTAVSLHSLAFMLLANGHCGSIGERFVFSICETWNFIAYRSESKLWPYHRRMYASLYNNKN